MMLEVFDPHHDTGVGGHLIHLLDGRLSGEDEAAVRVVESFHRRFPGVGHLLQSGPVLPGQAITT
jgi:hypothetical protein